MGNNNTMLTVDGVRVKTPSSMTISLQDVSRSDSGRTQDALMHKNKIAEKVKIDLAWANPKPAEVQAILAAFSPEYFNVTFFYPKTGTNVTKRFYCGDRTMPIKVWNVNNKLYESLAFNIIER